MIDVQMLLLMIIVMGSFIIVTMFCWQQHAYREHFVFSHLLHYFLPSSTKDLMNLNVLQTCTTSISFLNILWQTYRSINNRRPILFIENQFEEPIFSVNYDF